MREERSNRDAPAFRNIGISSFVQPIPQIPQIETALLQIEIVSEYKSRFAAGRSQIVARRARFAAGRKNDKSGAKGGARANSHPGPWTMVNSMSKEHISEKKLK